MFFRPNQQFVVAGGGVQVSQPGAPTAVWREYAELLRDTYGADEVWPLVDITAGTTVHAFVNGSRDGTLAGWDLQNAEGPLYQGGSAPLSGDAGDYGNILSASLSSIFDGDVGSVLCAVKVSNADVWTDGTVRLILRLWNDADNRVQLYRHDTNNKLYFYREADGTGWGIWPTLSSVRWLWLGMSWDVNAGASGELKAFINGEQVDDIKTNIDNFVGTCDTYSVIGAPFPGHDTTFDGWLAFVAVTFGSTWSPAQFEAMHEAALIAGRTEISSYSDDFSDNDVDASVWTVTEALSGNSTASIDEQNEQLEMSMTDATDPDHTYLSMEPLRYISGDFDAQVDFTLDTVTDTDRWAVYISARSYKMLDDDTCLNEVRASIEYDPNVGANRVYGGEIRNDGNPEHLDGEGTYVTTSDSSGKLRIRRSGATAYCYYWNGAAWVEIESGAIGDSDMFIFLWIYTGNENLPDIEVTFDNFSLS
jgi:hypothetical protein